MSFGESHAERGESRPAVAGWIPNQVLDDIKKIMCRQKTILLLLIIAIAVFFRFYKLNEIPPGLYPDVAVNGTDATQALKTGDFKIYYPENNGREGLFMNLIALSFWFFGQSVWAIKVVPAFFGVLTVLGTYFLTKQLFNYLNPPPPSLKGGSSPPLGGVRGDLLFSQSDAIALLSTFFLAISFWHVNFSRLGFRAIMVPFFLVWSIYFLLKGLNPPQPSFTKEGVSSLFKGRLGGILLILVAGLLFGLGFHTYISFRVAPLILLPIFIFDIIKHWPRPKIWRWLIFALGIIIAASPMIYYFYNNPGDFMGRATQVSVLSSKNPALTLTWSAIKTLGQFVAYGDPNQRHNISGSPEIFWPLIPFFIIGIAYSIRQIFKKQNYLRSSLSLITCHYVLLTWWSSMLLPSIFTNEGLPHALRSIGAIPPSYIFTGLGFFLIVSKYKSLPTSLFQREELPSFRRGWGRFFPYCILIFLFLTVLTAAEYYRYFIFWGQAKATQSAFAKDLYDEGIYLKNLPQNVKKYLIINEGSADPCPEGLAISAHTMKFLAPANTEFTYRGCEKFKQLLINAITKPTVFLPQQKDENLLNQLHQAFPKGNIENHNDFSVFKIGF